MLDLWIDLYHNCHAVEEYSHFFQKKWRVPIDVTKILCLSYSCVSFQFRKRLDRCWFNKNKKTRHYLDFEVIVFNYLIFWLTNTKCVIVSTARIYSAINFYLQETTTIIFIVSKDFQILVQCKPYKIIFHHNSHLR